MEMKRLSEMVWHPEMNQTEHVLWQLQNRDIHDPDFRYLKSFAGSKGLFVDVGANRGQSAVSVRMVWPECRIVAFEPSPSLRLRQALDHMADVLEDMTVHFTALGDRETEMVMITPVVDGEETLEQGTLEPEQMTKPYILEGLHRLGSTITTVEQIVPVRTLDSYLLKPAVIKIDAEGFELKVLEGARETLDKYKPLLLIENNDWGRVTEYLRGFGYRCYQYMAEEDKLVPLFGQVANAFYLPY
jgi:FkbM family methyltransferase